MRKASPLRKRLRNSKTLVRKRTRFLRSKKPERLQELPDPFAVIGPVPKGRAYQWVALGVLGDKNVTAMSVAWFSEAGWKPVPARRHPGMPHDKKGHIIVGDQVLAFRKFQMFADVLQLQNDHGSSRGHIKVFDHVRLTTEKVF